MKTVLALAALTGHLQVGQDVQEKGAQIEEKDNEFKKLF